MSCKRLLCKRTFVIMLAIIPVCALLLKLSITDDSGVLRIGLYSEGSDIGEEIVKDLLKRDSIVDFTNYTSEKEARNAVMADKIQGAWIFPADLGERIDTNAKNGSVKPLVKVIEREETIPLKLSHELLYGCLHPYVAYSNYEHFTEERYGDMATVDKNTLCYHYETAAPVGEVLVMKVVGNQEIIETTDNFLTFPLRGILSLLVVLCTLASVMYFLSDKASGKFDRLPASKHILPEIGSCLCASLMSAFAVLVSVYIIGVQRSVLSELAAMLLYVICVCGFCLVFGTFFGKAERLGTFIPFIMIIMMVQCPVFLNIDALRPLWFLFPPSYYLYAVYDKAFMWYMIIYSVICFALVFILNIITSRKTRAKS